MKEDAPIQVEYQRIFWDWRIADGLYSPRQLREAGIVHGPVQTYELTWPGGMTQPPVEARKPLQKREQSS